MKNSSNSLKSNDNQKHQYSYISMLAIIIGTVIGSGIYIKNSSLIETTNSALLSIIGWLLGGLIVVAILISFIEISSITKIKNEQGTLGAFSKYLLSPKLTKLISGYFVFIYFPFIIAAESIFASNQLFLGVDDGLSSIADGWGWFIITTLSVISVVIITSIVIYFVKTTNTIQISGTILKLIPLILLIFIALFFLFGLTTDNLNDYNNVFDVNDEINVGWNEEDGQSNIVKILLIVPPILFAFDGFLFANSLSQEAKSENTYKFAAISAIIIITLVYLFFSLSTFLLGDATTTNGKLDANNFSITNVFINIFGESAGQIIGEIISFIIFISIITAVFGYAISSMWAVADSSNINEIRDTKGTFVRRIDNGHPKNAAIMIMIISIIIIMVLRIYDGIGLILEDDVTGIYVGMTDFITNISTLLNFTFYTLLICGAFANRFTKRVKVEKTKMFYPAAIFAILSISLVILVLIYNIFYELFNNPNLGIVILQIIMVITFFASIIIFIWWNTWKVKKTTDDQWTQKKPYQEAYTNKLTYEEYLNIKNNDNSLSKNSKKSNNNSTESNDEYLPPP